MLSGYIYDTSKNFRDAYLIATVCLLIAAGLTFATRAPKAKVEETVRGQEKGGGRAGTGIGGSSSAINPIFTESSPPIFQKQLSSRMAPSPKKVQSKIALRVKDYRLNGISRRHKPSPTCLSSAMETPH